jgi:hypothetical protein
MTKERFAVGSVRIPCFPRLEQSCRAIINDSRNLAVEFALTVVSIRKRPMTPAAQEAVGVFICRRHGLSPELAARASGSNPTT